MPHVRSGKRDGYIVCPGTLPGGTPCRLVLAERLGSLLVVKKGSYEIVAENVHSVRCDRCGTRSKLADLAYPHPLLREPTIETPEGSFA